MAPTFGPAAAANEPPAPQPGPNASQLLSATPSPQLVQTTVSSSSSSQSSTSTNTAAAAQQARHATETVSFHLKSGLFTRPITIDSDKMALGLVKQLAIAFLNEVYFQHSYPSQTFIGDYLRKHFASHENVSALYERLILRIYKPAQDSFVPFNSVSDIQADSYVSIEISERKPSSSTTPSLAPALGSQTVNTSHQLQHNLASANQRHSQQLSGSALSVLVLPANGAGAGGSSQANQHQHQQLSPNYQIKISHDFHTATYIKPTYCASCSALIIGVFKQGFQCAHCKRNYCPKCKHKSELAAEGCLALGPSAGEGSTNANSAGHNHPATSPSTNAGQHQFQQATHNSEKLDVASNFNMSKRKSASNLLHFNIANPFKSHHAPAAACALAKEEANNSALVAASTTPTARPITNTSASQSVRGSTGAPADMIMQLLNRHSRGDQNKLVAVAAAEQSGQQRKATSSKNNNNDLIPGKENGGSGASLVVASIQQLSSSHQNLHTYCNRDIELPTDGGGGGSATSGSSSAQQTPSKQAAGCARQLSNSARSSAQDVALLGNVSPAGHAQDYHHHQYHQPAISSATKHAFISLDWVQIYGEPNCGVCARPLRGSVSSFAVLASESAPQQALMCRTCKLLAHATCQQLALADCLSRVAECASQAADSRRKLSGELSANDGDNDVDTKRAGLRGTDSNLSRDNIRLHRLAPSVKHIKRPDLTRPIIEGWLQHKTQSDERARRHYWRLNETDITLYESDTSPRYFKAIAVTKITRVLSADSLARSRDGSESGPGGGQHMAVSAAAMAPGEVKQQTRSANASPYHGGGGGGGGSAMAEAEAMFAFEVSTGSVYLVQARDQSEASKWRESLASLKDQLRPESGNETAPQNDDDNNNNKLTPAPQTEPKHTLRPQRAPESASAGVDGKLLQDANDRKAGLHSDKKKVGRPHQHQHQHQNAQNQNHALVASGGGFAARGHLQQRTFTDPNRSRLYNRPRIVIKLDPMSVPDHWIEGKYLIERNRTKGAGFEELGSGQFGKVYAAISEIKAEEAQRGYWSGVPVAIKEISKARFDLRQQAKLKNEANILSRLDHPGVIILERVHDLPDKLYIVMEQLEDDMLEMIVSTEEKRLSERITKFLTYQILEALKYLHAQNIAHCDLKPENVLLCEQLSQFPQIKLCDFGFAKIIEENSFRSSLVGTPAYLAPEVVRGERYNRSVDLWSVGVIVYVSLSGEFPFNEGESIHEQISRANFMYPDQPWAKVSNQAKSFINSLLRVNSDKRLSASRAQMDAWIEDYQLWCDLCELELRVGRRWVTDDADFSRWSRYARQHQLQVPRAALQLHQELSADD